VKLIKRQGDAFVFHVGKREKRLLFEVLKLYPLIPAAPPRVGKSSDAGPAAGNQKLLQEALAERKQENKRQLLSLLKGDRRFQETDVGYRLTLTAPQIEWLLQVINDIRVGSWLMLGEPDETKGQPIELNQQNARYYAAMEFCGYFQITLLDAFERQP
jgi:hypothetical protein